MLAERRRLPILSLRDALMTGRHLDLLEGEFVCPFPCGITFEPLPWFDAELDEPVCDECADRQ
jgi:hypothetical protein